MESELEIEQIRVFEPPDSARMVQIGWNELPFSYNSMIDPRSLTYLKYLQKQNAKLAELVSLPCPGILMSIPVFGSMELVVGR